MYASKIVKLMTSSTHFCTYFSNVSRFNCSSRILKNNLSVIKTNVPFYLHNSFSTHSSPDDNHNVSKGKKTNKRRRILSSSDSSADEYDMTMLETRNDQYV